MMKFVLHPGWRMDGVHEERQGQPCGLPGRNGKSLIHTVPWMQKGDKLERNLKVEMRQHKA